MIRQFGFFISKAGIAAALAAVCSCLCIFSAAQSLPELPTIAVENFDPEIAAQVKSAYADARAAPRDARSNGWLGMILHAYEQYETAAICYELAKRHAPAEFRWAYYLGVVQAALGRQPEAAAAFREALRLDPGHLPAQLRLADALFAAGQASESKGLYETIVKRNPRIAQSYYGLGRIAAAGGDPAAAGAHYRKAIDLFAEYGAAHYALGLALRDQGNLPEARRHLEMSQRLKLSQPTLDDPEISAIAGMNAGASKHLRRGAMLGQEGKLSEAIAEHERALEINPWLVQARINLISLHGRTGRPEQAERHYRLALEINPDLPDIHYNYGVLLVGLDRYKEAASAFRRCLDLDPYYAEAHFNYGAVIEREGRLDEAATHFRRAVENNPGHRLAHFHLGRILVHKGKLPDAIERFLLTLTPEDEETPRFRYALGATYIRAGERLKGIESLREALRLASALGQTGLVKSIEQDLQRLEPPAPAPKR